MLNRSFKPENPSAGGELHNFHIEPLRVYSHRTQKVSLSSNTNFWWIFSYFALISLCTLRMEALEENQRWKKHGKKQKQTASGKVLGKHLPATTSERYYTRIQSSNYGGEKYLAKANESFQFPEAKRCRNWMVKNKFNLPELHASLDITRTQIDWNRLGCRISPERESIKPANKKSNRPRKSFQFTEKSFKLNEKFRNLPTDDI